METFERIIWNPLTLILLGGLVLWIINKVFAAVPSAKKLWDDVGGYVLTGIKVAEKLIPDDTTNKGLHRADYVLKYVLAMKDSMGRKMELGEITEEVLAMTPDDVQKKLDMWGIDEDALRQLIAKVHVVLKEKGVM